MPSEIVWYGALEVAKKLGVSKMTVYRMIRRGELQGSKFGKTFRIQKEDLEQYMKDSLITPDK